jgi:glycerol-3-phosphate cytidylyltransferase
MKKVLTYGTYDLLHDGHIHLLRRARELGDYLVVGLSTNEFNTLKHKEAIMTFDQRRLLLESLKYVDEVIPEETWEQKISDIQKHNISIFVMGNDWEGEFDFLKDYCEVIYLPRTPDVSTTQLKQRINELNA